MKTSVLEGNRQAKPRAACCAGASWIGAPEAVEHECGLTRAKSDAIITNCHGDRILIHVNDDVDTLAITVLNRVVEEIAKDALNSTGVGLDAVVMGTGEHAH